MRNKETEKTLIVAKDETPYQSLKLVELKCSVVMQQGLIISSGFLHLI